MQTSIECATKQIMSNGKKSMFNRIYPFTTENIGGYIDEFDLHNKSLLTVGSSSDQVINACLKGCKDITLIDINPFIKEYFYLKKAAIMSLNYKEFFKFLSFNGDFFPNNRALDDKIYMKVMNNIESYSSQKFWNTIYFKYGKVAIKNKMFSKDINRPYVLKQINPYLKDEREYSYIKFRIEDLKPKFIVGNIHKYELNRNYDNIFLSNISDYNTLRKTYTLFEKLKKNLNEKMLIAYLYDTTKDTPYEYGCPKIYDINNTLNKFKECDLKSFKGVNDLRINGMGFKDSILVYTKK